MNDLITNNLADLGLFARVVESGGFTAAFKATGIPQATISRRIAGLEHRLNVRLLERTTRTVNITPVGRRIYDHARRIVNESLAAEAAARALQAEPSGLLRITAPYAIGQSLLGTVIADLLGRHPKLQVQVELTGRQVDLVEEGFDVAIRIGPLADSSLIRNLLGTAEAGFYAAHDFVAEVGPFSIPEDVTKAPWLHPATAFRDDVAWDVIGPDKRQSFSAKPVLTSNDIDILIATARAGKGITQLPTFAAPEDLVRILPDHSARQVEINALMPSHRSIVPSVTRLVGMVREALAGQSN